MQRQGIDIPKIESNHGNHLHNEFSSFDQIVKRFKEFKFFPNGPVCFDQSVHIMGSCSKIST